MDRNSADADALFEEARQIMAKRAYLTPVSQKKQRQKRRRRRRGSDSSSDRALYYISPDLGKARARVPPYKGKLHGRLEVCSRCNVVNALITI
jgi:hypothetical protein